MPPHHGASGAWEHSVPLALIFVFLALAYLRGSLRLRSAEERVSAWRAVAFFVGLFLIWAALGSPIAALDHKLLTAHMIQHLLLMTIGPPLIWVGEPVMAFSIGLPPQLVNAFALHKTLLRRLTDTLTRPMVGLFAASVVLVGWHIPAVFSLTMKSEAWYIIEQATFLAAGLLFWWPVVQPWPSIVRPDWLIILYLFFATLPCDILSGFLVFCDRVVYPAYLPESHFLGFSALGDQQCAGALMWTCVTLVYLVAGSLLALQLLSPHAGVVKPAPSGNRMIMNLGQERVEAL